MSLTNFAFGPHEVTCFSGAGGRFDSYTTTATISTHCFYDGHGAVWVVVDGSYKSNVVIW